MQHLNYLLQESLVFTGSDINILDNCISEQQTDLAMQEYLLGKGGFVTQEATFSYNNEQESSLSSDTGGSD